MRKALKNDWIFCGIRYHCEIAATLEPMKDLRITLWHVLVRNRWDLTSKISALDLLLYPFRSWWSLFGNRLIPFEHSQISKNKNLAQFVFRNSLFANEGIWWHHLKFEHLFHLLLFLFTYQISVFRENIKKELIDILFWENAQVILVFDVHVIEVLW